MLIKSLQSIKGYQDTLLFGYTASPYSYNLTGNLFQKTDTDKEFHICYLCIPMDKLNGKKVY